MIPVYFSTESSVTKIISKCRTRQQVPLKGQTAGYVSRKAPTVHVSWVTCGTLAVPGHGVSDAHWTSFNVFHLIRPVPITDLLFGPVIMADVDRILSSTPTDDSM